MVAEEARGHLRDCALTSSPTSVGFLPWASLQQSYQSVYRSTSLRRFVVESVLAGFLAL
jgi:hypothetical protein